MEERKNKMQTVEDVQLFYLLYTTSGFNCRWSGLCIWIEQEVTDDKRSELQAAGARWSGKRQQWYFRADEGLPKDIEFDAKKFLEVA